MDDLPANGGFPGFELDGDHILAVKLIPTARNLLYQLESFMKSSGTQVFSMTRHVDNGYIHVSSSGGIKHAYIYAAEKNVDPEPELESIEILSGIVKDGKIVNIVPPVLGSQPYEILREYKPTKQAVKYPLKGKGSDASFNDEKRLAVRVEAGVDPDYPHLTTTSQYKGLCSSMYSGYMAKAVQVIMGYGKLKSLRTTPENREQGVKVRYDWRWARNHGVVMGANKVPWLVEISVVNGVIAMPLPRFINTVKDVPGSLYPALLKSKQDVLRETVKIFGGLPSGGTFPTGGDLVAAITAGDVLQLIPAAGMDAYFSKSPFSTWMGWSFNEGTDEIPSVAHNTCYEYGEYIAPSTSLISGQLVGTTSLETHVTSFHYKLSFTIGAINVARQLNDPVATASATLTLEESGILAGTTLFEGFGGELIPTVDFLFYDHNNSKTPVDRANLLPFTLNKDAQLALGEKTTFFVCHRGNVLDKLVIQAVNVQTASLSTPSITINVIKPDILRTPSVFSGTEWWKSQYPHPYRFYYVPYEENNYNGRPYGYGSAHTALANFGMLWQYGSTFGQTSSSAFSANGCGWPGFIRDSYYLRSLNEPFLVGGEHENTDYLGVNLGAVFFMPNGKEESVTQPTTATRIYSTSYMQLARCSMFGGEEKLGHKNPAIFSTQENKHYKIYFTGQSGDYYWSVHSVNGGAVLPIDQPLPVKYKQIGISTLDEFYDTIDFSFIGYV